LPRKLKSATFHFLDGPIELELREGQTQPLRSWWRRKAAYEIEEVSLEETLALVTRTWEEYGPFDGILGFSMGGVLACQIAIRLKFPTLKFVMLAGSPDHPSITSETLPKQVHSLHLWGLDDKQVEFERSKGLYKKWRNKGEEIGDSPKCIVIEHDGGHCIPTKAVYLNQYCKFIEMAFSSPSSS
jgi:predicted esterase